MLENVLKAINDNSNIDASFKENIQSLVIIFSNFFPQISLNNLENRMKSLKIEKINKLVSKKIYDYKPIENKLCFSSEALNSGYDAKHMLMSSILCMITAHDNTYGFDKDNKLTTFNIGYTEILSNFLVGNESEISLYDDEVVATNLMAEVIGNDTFFEAYFTNNFQLVFDKITQVGDGENVRSY